MTSKIFNDWLNRINTLFRKKNKTILLIVDNCSSHTVIKELSNVTVKFLPPNTTSKTQPLDQGVIHSFKARYRSMITKDLICKIDTVKNAEEYLKSLNLLKSIEWINDAWTQLPESVIVNCFRHSGVKETNSNVEEIFESDDQSITNNLKTDIDFLNMKGILTDAEVEFDEGDDNTEADDWRETLLSQADSSPDER